MKKWIAMLMTLCLLCAGAAFADTEAPTFDSMPMAVYEDENTTVEEAAFQGEWVLNVAFLDETYLDETALAELGYNFAPFRIADGKIMQDVQDENGEFHTVETTYTFDASQLQAEDDEGVSFVFELLEDGNVAMTVFIPREGDVTSCLTVFMVHPEAE